MQEIHMATHFNPEHTTVFYDTLWAPFQAEAFTNGTGPLEFDPTDPAFSDELDVPLYFHTTVPGRVAKIMASRASIFHCVVIINRWRRLVSQGLMNGTLDDHDLDDFNNMMTATGLESSAAEYRAFVCPVRCERPTAL